MSKAKRYGPARIFTVKTLGPPVTGKRKKMIFEALQSEEKTAVTSYLRSEHAVSFQIESNLTDDEIMALVREKADKPCHLLKVEHVAKPFWHMVEEPR